MVIWLVSGRAQSGTRSIKDILFIGVLGLWLGQTNTHSLFWIKACDYNLLATVSYDTAFGGMLENPIQREVAGCHRGEPVVGTVLLGGGWGWGWGGSGTPLYEHVSGCRGLGLGQGKFMPATVVGVFACAFATSICWLPTMC